MTPEQQQLKRLVEEARAYIDSDTNVTARLTDNSRTLEVLVSDPGDEDDEQAFDLYLTLDKNVRLTFHGDVQEHKVEFLPDAWLLATILTGAING